MRSQSQLRNDKYIMKLSSYFEEHAVVGHEQFGVSCLDCGNSQTLLHVMSGCEKHLHQGRYTWRHNSVPKALVSFLLPRGIGELYVDLEGFVHPRK